ncbi:NifU family protein [Sphingomicrobium sediminis]|uniref:NifU family protein n=1 Tax=Sphingomicrobium sediminis TaxID=2950949 RepID=A0A9X2J0I6_9SPHN|nr:NifU family protein [Sphingomicrobium sediminis]MCM8556313.1 NifU family protein [Sphingomicrobium sediminis]
MLIQTEKTPNPSTRKFLPGRTVMESGGRDFPTPESAEASPLAEAIFNTGMVDGVYFGRDFVSVSAAPSVEWTQLEPEVLQILMDHFLTETPLFKPGSAADIDVAPDSDVQFEDDPADADIIDQIKELIETRVRPAVAQDGGDIVYRGYKEGHVFLQLQGACSGCPSSTITLKNGIEGLIKHYVPEVVSVEAV